MHKYAENKKKLPFTDYMDAM